VPSEIRSRVLFIEDRVPSLRLGAGFGRSEIIVRKLLEMSDLDIFACDAESSDLAPDDFRCISVTYGPDPAPLQKLLSSRHYDAVYVCRPHNLARYVDVLRAWKQNGGKIVYDTEAIFAVREVSQMERAESYAEITASPQFAAEADKELQWAELADVIIAVNDLEATILRQRLSRPVFIVGHYLPARLLQPRPRDRSGLLFVGALHDSRSPNYDSLLWFLDRVWPRIRAVRPDETLRIAGFVGAGVAVDALRQDGVACLGALTELTSEYAHARVSIAPTRFAAGIPFKVHEALSYGLPAVVSQLIDEQLSHTTEYDNPVLAATVNDDGKMFYEACLQLLTDDELWLRKHKAALAFVIRFCAPGLLTDTIDALLHEIGADATGSRPSGLGYLVAIGMVPVLHLMDNLFHIRRFAPEASESARRIFGTIDFLENVEMIVMSRRLQSDVEQTLCHKLPDVTLVPGWVDPTLVPETITARGPCAQEHIRFVFSSRIVSHKGIDLALEAARSLVEAGHENFRLDIYGAGESAALVQQVIAFGLADRVCYRGVLPKSEMTRRLGDYDALLFPTMEREPFGFVVAEAAAAGCIPVVTNGIGAAEWFFDGIDCLKIQRTCADLAAAMRRLLLMSASERQEMRRQAWKTAHLFLDSGRALSTIEKVIQRAAARSEPVVPQRVRACEAALTLLDDMCRLTDIV